MRRFLRAVWVAGVVAAAVGVAGPVGAEEAPGQPPALVKVDAVRLEPLSQTVPVLGRFVARQSGVVAARARGPVAEVLVQVGERVERGQVLARLENLRRSGSAAFQRARYDDTVQRVAIARANLRLARIELRDAEIRAPYPGVVTQRHTEAGAYLDVGQPVVTLVNDKDLDIEADVPVERLAGLTPGRRVRVTFGGAAQDFDAVVRAVVPEENPMTRTRAVRFTPRYSDGTRGLAVNESVTLHVPVGAPRQVVTVHKDAIVHRKGASLVFVVVDDRARVRPVRLGDAVGTRFEVLEGLAPGEVVVIRGNERLLPGQPVRIDRES